MSEQVDPGAAITQEALPAKPESIEPTGAVVDGRSAAEKIKDDPELKSLIDAAVQQGIKNFTTKADAAKAKTEAAKAVAAIKGDDGKEPPEWAKSILDKQAALEAKLANSEVEKVMTAKNVPMKALKVVKAYIDESEGDIDAGVMAYLVDYPSPPKDLGPDVNLPGGKDKQAPLTPDEKVAAKAAKMSEADYAKLRDERRKNSIGLRRR